MIAEQVRQMSVEEYLAFEEASDVRHECIDGEIYPMTGGTLNHSRLIARIIAVLSMHIAKSNCEVLSSDMRIRVAPTRFVYPDVSVVLGEPLTEYNTLTLLNPTLVVEVTSPSSIDYDRGSKREYYGDVPSIKAYLVVDQHRVLAELYTRSESGWHIQCFSDIDEEVPLVALDCSLPLAEVYRGITFEEEMTP